MGCVLFYYWIVDTNVPSVSSDQDLANNLQVQDSVSDLSSTPIVHEGRNQVKDAF